MDKRLYESTLAQDSRRPVERTSMIGAVALKLQAHQLDSAREALSTAQQAAGQEGAAATPEVILELSAEAQQLMSLPLY
jgi:hypothetical protein